MALSPWLRMRTASLGTRTKQGKACRAANTSRRRDDKSLRPPCRRADKCRRCRLPNAGLRRYDPLDVSKNPETHHVRPDAAATLVDLVADRFRAAPPRRFRNRFAPGGRRHPPLHLARGRPPREAGGPRARRREPAVLGPCRHAGVERLPPPRAVFRRER